MTVPTGSGMDAARAIADAVLYEGYLLYPYRASAAKNKVRWQWGVLMPPSYAGGGTGERAHSRTELVAEPSAGAALHVRLRFLQLQRRVAELPGASRDGSGYRAVPSVTVGDTEYTTWEEAVEREVDAVLRFADLLGTEWTVPFRIQGGEDVEPIPGGEGARVARRRDELRGEVVLRADPLPGPFGGVRLAVRVANVSPWHGADATREEALRHALIGAHTLLSLDGGHFLSATDPPEWASVVTKECRNDGAWPVLVGDPGPRDTVLCSPIILYDHPEIAQQSAGDLFDGTEIDEILTLRTMTLTEEEKRQARATDARAAALVDRVDNLPPELLDRLHGTVRYLREVTGGRRTEPADLDTITRPEVPWWDPGADASVSPETDEVTIDGVAVRKGSRVRLRPGGRADAHDMFLAGRIARRAGRPARRRRPVAPRGHPGGRPRRRPVRRARPVPVLRHGRGRAAVTGTRVLVAGIGNVFLGDDGFGVEVVARLAGVRLPDWAKVVDYGVRGMHLAYDLAGADHDLTIMVDATARGDLPGTVYVVELDRPDPEEAAGSPPLLDAHGMQPDVVMRLVGVLGGDPGRVLLVGCEPEVLDHRMGLSPVVESAVDTAVRVVVDLVGWYPFGTDEELACALASLAK